MNFVLTREDRSASYVPEKEENGKGTSIRVLTIHTKGKAVCKDVSIFHCNCKFFADEMA